jgi:hypothetical protein
VVVWGGCDGGGVVVVEKLCFDILCYVISITFYHERGPSALL